MEDKNQHDKLFTGGKYIESVDSEILQSDRVMGLPRKSSGELY
jgi:hypothetical protein